MKQKKQSLLLAVFMAGLLAPLVPTIVHAQDDFDLDDDSYDTDAIDVEGQMRDRIKDKRQNLENKHERKMLKNMEDVRVREERKMADKLNKAFSGGLSDDVSTKSAAVKKEEVVVAPAPAPAESNSFEEFKVTPVIGYTSITSDLYNFESSYTIGVTVESMMTDHLSVGVGIGYSALKITEIEQNNNPWYTNSFGTTQREINYTQISADLVGKFYFTIKTRVRPYAGASLGVSRLTMAYADKGRVSTYDPYYNAPYGDENYQTSFATGAILIGSDIMFSDTVGLNAELRAGKAMAGGQNSRAGYNNQNSVDQVRLNQIGEKLKESTFIGFGLGLAVHF